MRRGDDDGGVPFIPSLELAPFPADIYKEMDESIWVSIYVAEPILEPYQTSGNDEVISIFL